MASLVPDEIIYNFSDYSTREYNAALMFADVSGMVLSPISSNKTIFPHMVYYATERKWIFG